MKKISQLVAVDWGTTSLRAARLDASGQMLEERTSVRGILSVAKAEFSSVFDSLCGDWMATSSNIALVSGMAGSKQGWVEAPYCPCPAGFDEIAAQITWLGAQHKPDHAPWRIAIVPGLSCEHAHAPDVMRGEEVQILGAMQLLGLRDGLFVLPGTHSKWARVKEGRVVSFKTRMTGEVYALLGQHSLLSKSLQADAPLDEIAFSQGVRLAQGSEGLLHLAFTVRTLSLFSRMNASALTSYLSGLVIGEELRAQCLPDGLESVLIGSNALTTRYALALEQLGLRTRQLGAEATWAGLHALAMNLPNA